MFGNHAYFLPYSEMEENLFIIQHGKKQYNQWMVIFTWHKHLMSEAAGFL